MTGPGEAPASEAASTRPVGAFIYDLGDERCVFCSGFFAALHGLEVEACRRLAPGERVSRFVHPEDQERYRRIVGHARAMRAPYDIAYRLVQPDGRVLDVQEAAEPWQDGESGQWRLVGFAEDVTLRRRAEAALKRANEELEQHIVARTAELHAAKDAAEAAGREAKAVEERFIAAAEALADGLAIYDHEDRLAYCNRRYPELAPAGFRTAMAIGKRFEDMVREAVRIDGMYHPDMGPDFAERRFAHRQGPAEDTEFRIADGRWMRVRENAIAGGGRVLLVHEITEQRAATLELEEREQRLRAVADGIPLPIVIARVRQPEILFVNAAAERTFGLRLGPQPEAIRNAYVQRGVRARLVHQLLSAGAVEGFEAEMRRADGTTMWALISARMIPVAGELAILVAVSDISERKTSEQALEEREEQFRAIANGVPLNLLIARLDPAEILFANERAQETLGLEGGSRDDRVLGVYADPGERARLVARLRQEGRIEHHEVLLRRADGMSMWGLIAARLMTFRGAPAMLATITDISERKAAEEALRASEARLRSSEQRFRVLAEAHPVPLVIVGVEDAIVLLASPACEAFFGVALQDFVGSSILSFYVDPEDRVRIMASVRQEGSLSGYEVQMRRSDGTPFWVAFDSRLITYEDKVAVVAAYVDLTEKKRAEAELERQREVLLQSEKMSALGSLLASVAHELNNPLSVVVGQSTMLQELAAGSAMAERAAKIRVAADRCARIVKTFLAMARSKPPERREVRLGDAIRDALDLAGYGLRSTGIQLDLDLADDLPPLFVDGDQLHQVLTNLIINAKQALQAIEGERRLSIRTLLEADGRMVRLELADTGPGIPPEMRERVFEPFFTTKPQGVGTGIGLSVSRRIINAHGGTISIEGRQGGGAAFIVRLPIGHPSPAAPESGDGAAAAVVRATALVVDDEPDIAEVLAEILRLEGFAVDVADGGRQALERIGARDYDLVISDLRMPDMDGPALFRTLERERPEIARRMLLITGDTLSPDASAFVEGSGVPVIEKPFDARRIRRLAAQVARDQPTP